MLNRLEPYLTPEFKDALQVEESADTLGEDAAALKEEYAWKQIAKKRIKASALGDEGATAPPPAAVVAPKS